MNGYSILFAVLVIVSIAIIIGTLVLSVLGGYRLMPQPHWPRRRPHHHH